MQQQQKAAALAHSGVRAAPVVLYDRHMTPSVRYGAQTPAEPRGEMLRAEGSSSLRQPHWSERERGRRRRLEAGRAICQSGKREWRWAGLLLRGTTCGLGGPRCAVRKQKARESFHHKQPAQEVGQPGACAFDLLLCSSISELKLQFDNNGSPHFTNVRF